MFKALVVFLLLLVAALGTWLFLRPAAPLTVDVVTVESGDIASTLQLTGRVINDRTVTITALLDGEITAINARQGDRVESNTILASLNNQIAAAQVTKAEADLLYQRRNLQITGSNYSRIKKLSDKGSATKQALDDALLEMRRAEASFKVAEADLAIRQLQLECAEVKAPFAGTIIEQHAEVGQWVEAGSRLFKLVADDGRVVEMQVDAGDAQKVSLGQAASMRLEAQINNAWQGEIIWLAPAITTDDNSNSFAARVGLGPDAPELMLDQQVDVELQLDSRSDVVLIEQAALQSDADGYFVFMLEQGTSSIRRIETGLFSINNVEVTSGLDSGEQVIVPGLTALQDGSRVEAR